MLVNPDLYSEVFESIKSDLYESSTKKVCVIVSTSCVDSICAAKILHVSACCTASIPSRQRRLRSVRDQGSCQRSMLQWAGALCFGACQAAAS